MADKIDITEELVRMDSHLQQFGESLNAKGNIGRKMDFIVQEYEPRNEYNGIES